MNTNAPKLNKTEIIAILDRSGSMSSILNDAIGGFNAFLADQKTVPGEAKMTIVLFDDKNEVLYEAKPLESAEPLTRETFTPRGMTALQDAIGYVLNVQGERIAKEAWADKVVVCILTDGGENSSKEFTKARVKEMITHAEANGWVFIFLAANQDAFETGAGYGISAATTANFSATGAGVTKAYGAMGASLRSVRSSS